MLENGKISVRQLKIIIMLYSIGTTILIIPSGLATYSKQDAWIASVLGTVLGLLVAWFYIQFGNLFPKKSIMELCDVLLGRWLGSLISLLLSFFGFIGAVTLLYHLGNFMTTQIIPETPIIVINLIFAGVVVMGLRLGLETIARTAEIFFPWVFGLFLILILLVSPQAHLQNIQPVFEAEGKSIVYGALQIISVSAFPLIVLFGVYPAQVNNFSEAKKAYMSAVLISGLVIILITLMSILVLGADTTSRNMYPSYALAKKISIGHFVERIEVIVAVMWLLTIYFKTTFYFYSCLISFAHVLRMKNYRPLTFPFGIILVAYSQVVYPNVVYMSKWDTETFMPFSLIYGLCIPLLLMAAYFLQKKRLASRSQQ